MAGAIGIVVGPQGKEKPKGKAGQPPLVRELSPVEKETVSAISKEREQKEAEEAKGRLAEALGELEKLARAARGLVKKMAETVPKLQEALRDQRETEARTSELENSLETEKKELVLKMQLAKNLIEQKLQGEAGKEEKLKITATRVLELRKRAMEVPEEIDKLRREAGEAQERGRALIAKIDKDWQHLEKAEARIRIRAAEIGGLMHAAGPAEGEMADRMKVFAQIPETLSFISGQKERIRAEMAAVSEQMISQQRSE